MDLRDIVGGGESGLPTLSTGTMTATPGTAFTAPTNAGLVKFGISSLAGLLGMYYLAVGKKESDARKMVIGAALSLGSLFLF